MTSSRTRGCDCIELCVRFRGNEQNSFFYGQYERIGSYFAGTELASNGLPEGRELEILQTVRDKLPPEVFTTEVQNPVGGSAENVRTNLREALGLLKEAGYEVRDRKLVDVKSGALFEMELLTSDPSFERVTLFYKPSLERLEHSAQRAYYRPHSI